MRFPPPQSLEVHMSALPLVVVETESGAEVRLRDADAGEAYPTLRAALDSLLSDNDFRPKRGILRDESGHEVGQWRWLDATAEEAVPYEDGFQITHDVIATAAAGLNAGTPVPIDGGTTPAHTQITENSSALSDGYAHVGVEVLDTDGRWHLYLYAEIDPDVVKATDSGRLAYGSVGVHRETFRLMQHSLTNIPAVEGLNPNNATRSIAVREMRISMPKISKRATLAEAEPMLIELLGVSAEELGTTLVELAAKHKADKAEDAAEKPADAEMESAPVESAEAREQPASEEPVKRAVPGLEDQAALEAFASSVVGGMQDLFGKPEASPSELLDLFTASLAAFKGALGQGAPAADAAGDAAAMSQDTAAAARAALTEIPALRAKVAALSAEVTKRDTRESIQRRAVEAKATLSGEQLEQLVADTLAVTDTAVRERMIVNALRSSVVPTGDVFARTSKTAGPAPQSITEAAESLLPEIEKANPNTARHVLVSMAQRAAIARFPHLSA